MRADAGLERRHEVELRNGLWIGDIADIKDHKGRAISEKCAIALNHCRTVEGDAAAAGPGRSFTLLLSGHPPPPGLLGIFGIADVQENENLTIVAGHIG